MEIAASLAVKIGAYAAPVEQIRLLGDEREMRGAFKRWSRRLRDRASRSTTGAVSALARRAPVHEGRPPVGV